MLSTDILTFGPFHLDLRAEQLWRGIETVPLPPKTFAVLRYLVLHAGTLVTRDAVLEAVWGTQYVSDAALASCIRDIRQALGEQAQTPQFLETVRGRGFRFLATLSTAPAHPPSPTIQRGPSSVVRAPALVVGRDTELALLQGCLDSALRGDRQIVFLTGEPGIGKTTLIDAFLSAVPLGQQEMWITRGQCVEHYGVGEAYLPVLEALGRLGQEANAAAMVAVLAQYAPTWLAQLPALVSMPEREGLQRTLQGATQSRMLREFADALEVLTTRCPVVLVLEDLHWSDTSTVALLTYVAQRRDLARLLVLGTYRPVDALVSAHPLHGAVQELQARGSCQALSLGFLHTGDVEAYVRGRLTRAPALPAVHHLATAIHQRTGGNPLFMVTVLEHLLQEGMIAVREGQWYVSPESPTGHEDIPDSLRQLIEKQFAGLRPEEQQLLEAASVAGYEFAVAAVAAGLDQSVDVIESWSAALAAKQQFIRAAGVEAWPDGTLAGRYRFVHALYHQAIYDRLAAAHRIRLHRRIGARKAQAHGTRVHEIAAELAGHFEAGHDLQQAVHYGQLAGETALRRHAHQEAIANLTHALALIPELPDTPERAQQELRFHVLLGPLWMAIKGYGHADVTHTYTRAQWLCRQVGERSQHFPVLWGMWLLAYSNAQYQRALDLGEQLLSVAQQRRDPALVLQAHHALWTTSFYCGLLTAAQHHIQHGLRSYTSQHASTLAARYGGHDPGVCGRHFAAEIFWLLGYPDQAVQQHDAALTWAQELSHPFSLAYALEGEAMLHCLRQDVQRTYERAEAGLALATAHGFRYVAAECNMLRGWALTMQGDGQAGIAQIRQGLKDFQGTGATHLQPWYGAVLVSAYAYAGQIDAGLETLTDTLARVEATGERACEAELYRLRGELLLKREPVDSSQATTCFRHALDIARAQQAKSWELRAATSLGRLWQQQGKRDEACQLVEGIYHCFTEGFDTNDVQAAEALLIELGSDLVRTNPYHRAAQPAAERLHGGAATMAIDTPLGVPPVPAVVMALQGGVAPEPLMAHFRHEGDYWTLVFQDTTCRVKDTYGMHYLAHLLRAPRHDIHVLTLVRESRHMRDAGALEVPAPTARQAHPPVERTYLGAFTDAGEVLDAPARAAYKQRLATLQAELAEAQRWNDLGRSAALQAEIELLTQELLRAAGLGGRARKTASPTERARVNTTRAIKSAITRIAILHPACGKYLARTITTGTFCVYTPDPQTPVTWQV